MKIFLDTNIVIDYLSNREPFGKQAHQIFLMSENPEIELCMSALSFTTIYYILRKECPHRQLLELLEGLRSLTTVVLTDTGIIGQAIKSDFADFEDAVQYYTAVSVNSDCIITRNTRDYVCAEIPVMNPTDFLEGH